MSTEAISAPLSIELLLRPFLDQSSPIRSIIVVGCVEVGQHQLWEKIGTEPPLAPYIEEISTAIAAREGLEGLARRAREHYREIPGRDLLLLSGSTLADLMTPPGEDFSFQAVAVLPADTDNQKLQRSLFDRGLICIGSVPAAGGKAPCYLASDTVRNFNRLHAESRGHVSMSVFLWGAAFGNQLFRYACLKLYALRHALTPALPAWEGQTLFGLEDRPCEGLGLPARMYPGFADNDREIWEFDDPPMDIDLDGYFQEIPECWRKHRPLLRHLFELRSEHLEAIEAWRHAVTKGGRRTLVAVHVRRGDYHRYPGVPQFRLVPEDWYLEWLRAIWPTLCDPVLFVGTDDPKAILPRFQEFETVSATFGWPAQELPDYIRDFEAMRRADYLAICNSSFGRMAAILAAPNQKCFLPSFVTQSFAPYEPWIDPGFWVRFADTAALAKEIQPLNRVAPIALPRDVYIEIRNNAEATSPALMCISGWGLIESPGARAARTETTIRFRADASAGTRINLVLRLAAFGGDFGLRIRSDSGDETDLSLSNGSERTCVLPCRVEPDELVTVNFSTAVGATSIEDEFSGESWWMLKGILYFDPKRLAE